MADRKISDLTALTTPATGDLLPIVDVSEVAAADKNKKITVQELFKGVPDGTAAAPGLAFESDDGNGIYLAGTDTVAISTGGTQRLSVNASGLVTIAGDLQVEGSTTTIESTTITIDDKNIELGSVDTPTDTTADGGGITLKGATDKTINWVNSTDAWTSSERFDFPAGTAAAPSIILNGDVNSGLYQPGADQVAISTGGTGRLFIDASGRVGVANSSPGSFYSGSHQLVVGNTGDQGITIKTGTSDTGRLHFADGTTGNEAYRGRIEYLHSSDLLRFGTAGNSSHMAIDSSGRLLIGTSSDSRDSSVVIEGNSGGSTAAGVIRLARGTSTPGASDDLGFLMFGDSGHNGASQILARRDGGTWTSGSSEPSSLIFRTTADGASSPTERMRIDSSGRVGIGTTSPLNTLHVNQSASGDILRLNTTSGSGQGIILGVDTTGGFTYWKNNTSSSYDMRFEVGGGEKLRIDSSGRVGIGTSSTSTNYGRLLHIHNPDGQGASLHLTDNSSGSTNSDGFEIVSHNSSAYLVQRENADMYFMTNGTNTRMVIKNDGKVGIGTTSPPHIFTVSDGGAAGLEVNPSGNDSGPFLQAYNRSTSAFVPITTYSSYIAFQTGSSPTEKVRIDSSGNVGIGTTSPASTLHINEGTNKNLRFDGGITEIGSVTGFFALNDAGSALVPFGMRAEDLRFATGSAERVRIESNGRTKFSNSAYGVERTATASAFDLATGNFWTCGAIAIPNPTNQVAGLLGSLRVTAAPTSFAANWKHPGGSYTAPTSFPAVAPFFVQASGTILLGSWTEGIA